MADASLDYLVLARLTEWVQSPAVQDYDKYITTTLDFVDEYI